MTIVCSLFLASVIYDVHGRLIQSWVCFALAAGLFVLAGVTHV